MRDFSSSLEHLSINTATVRKQLGLADKAGLLADPELATRRMKAVLAVRGFDT